MRPASWMALDGAYWLIGPARPAWLKAAAARFHCRPGRGISLRLSAYSLFLVRSEKSLAEIVFVKVTFIVIFINNREKLTPVFFSRILMSLDILLLLNQCFECVGLVTGRASGL